jgi:hypothetical protein
MVHILELTLRMVPNEFSELSRLQWTLLMNTPLRLDTFNHTWIHETVILRTSPSNTQHGPSKGTTASPYVIDFDFTLCMNDTIEFPFSNDLIGIGRQRCIHECKHPSICICTILKMTRPSFPSTVILDSFPFVPSRWRSGLWEMRREYEMPDAEGWGDRWMDWWGEIMLYDRSGTHHRAHNK